MEYKKGEFGYWWTVEKKMEDVAGKEYIGCIGCSHAGLTSLRGAPGIVQGYFDCSDNCLTSLRYGPNCIYGSFYCYGNLLSSLEYGPTDTAYFDCSDNKLTSLKGAPIKTRGSFFCFMNKLKSLKGAPKEVDGSFDCENNQLTSLKGAPDRVARNFTCNNNRLTSLDGMPKLSVGVIDAAYNRLTSIEALDDLEGTIKLVLIGNPDLKVLADRLPLESIDVYGDVYRWRGSTWSFFDGVQKEVATIRKSGSLTVYKMKDGTYAVHDGEAYAHGETLKEAKADLLYKRTSKDLSEYKELTLDSKLTLEECIKMYRSITGACSLGTKEFCSRRKLKKAYTVGEVIELTDGAYGNAMLRAFFNGER